MPNYADCTKVMYNTDMANKTQINLARLKRLMDKKGWKTGELAEYSRVKYQTVYSIVVGRRTNTASGTLKALAAALDTSTDYLLGEIDDDTPPIQKLPEGVRKLAEIANQLSETRQEELLRIAQVLRQVEQEKINNGEAARQRAQAGIDAAMNVVRSKYGEDVESELLSTLADNFPELADLLGRTMGDSPAEQKLVNEG